MNHFEAVRALVVAAHPDDIEIGCGGTLAALVRSGAAVRLLLATAGERGGSGQERSDEQRASAAILGVEQVEFLGYPDAELPLSPDLIWKVEAQIKTFAPSLIFTHHPEDTHQDHRTLSQAVVSASRYAHSVLFFEGPTSIDFHPHLFSDISDTFELKIAALKAHASQVYKSGVQGLDIVQIAHANAHFRGVQARVAAAEGFEALRMLLPVGLGGHWQVRPNGCQA
ncbi:MAG: hypothetical protein AUJ55_12340 [Proteobacteria bacterium CG1_02_64_396]|nr:MAG: hypothetical protein AUJ55_12340 [Proteobacteria bacterium CG1_02_64_396]